MHTHACLLERREHIWWLTKRKSIKIPDVVVKKLVELATLVYSVVHSPAPPVPFTFFQLLVCVREGGGGGGGCDGCHYDHIIYFLIR